MRSGCCKRLWWANALAIAPLLWSGCTWNTGCTDMGCGLQDGSTWQFSPRDDQWADEQDAAYVFTVRFDEFEFTCSGVLSDNIACDDPSLSVEVYRSGQGDSAYNAVYGLRLNTFPGATQLSIERDGQLVFDDDFNLVASMNTPNGEACGPTCTTWTETVTW